MREIYLHKFLKLLIITALLSVTASQVLAQPKVKVQGASYGGSGCPPNSASVTVSPDGEMLSILFDKYTIDASKPPARKVCNLSIPIVVPDGYQASLFEVDYRGYIAPKTSGTLRSDYIFAGSRGLVFEETFVGEINYNKRDSLVTVWTSCKASDNMRVNTSMVAKGTGLATIDSSDLAQRGLVYHIKYRTCK